MNKLIYKIKLTWNKYYLKINTIILTKFVVFLKKFKTLLTTFIFTFLITLLSYIYIYISFFNFLNFEYIKICLQILSLIICSKILYVLAIKKVKSTTGDYLFILRSLKIEIYSVEDFIGDVKKFYIESTFVSITILFLFLPFLILISVLQKITQLLMILWNILSMLINVITKEKLSFEPIVKLDNFNFSWKQIFIINFYDVPKANAFMSLYTFLNSQIKKKDHKVLLNRVIMVKTTGLSLNLIVKTIWSYEMIKKTIKIIPWHRKYVRSFVGVFIEEYRQKYSLVINGSLNDLYNFLVTKTLYFDIKLILNPIYEHIIDVKDFRRFKSMYVNTLKFFKDDFEDKLTPTPENLIDATSTFALHTAKLNNKPHLIITAAENLEIAANRKNFVLSQIFTHSKNLKITNSTIIQGVEIKQHVNIITGEKIPEDQTFNFFSAISKTYFKPFNSLLIANEYGVRSLRDAAIFSHIENIKMFREVNKVLDWNEIWVQTDGKKYFMNFQSLINDNKIARESIAYIDEKIPEIKKAIEFAIEEEMRKVNSQLKKLNEEFKKYPLLKDKKEIVEEINILEKNIDEWELSKVEIISDITKSFCSQLNYTSTRDLIEIGSDYFEEMEIGVLAHKLNLLKLNENQKDWNL